MGAFDTGENLRSSANVAVYLGNGTRWARIRRGAKIFGSLSGGLADHVWSLCKSWLLYGIPWGPTISGRWRPAP